MPQDLVDLLDDPSRDLLSRIRGVTATPVTPLAREFLRLGHAVSVFCLDPSVDSTVILVGQKLKIYVCPKRRFRAAACDFYGQERRLICDHVARENPEVLCAHWSYDHALGALDTGLPTVVVCHDTPIRYAWIAKNFFMLYHLVVAAVVIERAQHLIAVSPYTANHIRRWFCPSRPPNVIQNGLPVEVFARGYRRLQRHQPTGRAYTICSVGGWGKIKNCKTLLRAFSLIRIEVPDAQLVLYGSGLGAGEEAEVWAIAHGLSAGVVFSGKASRDTIMNFLENRADLMIHPSLVECHPMVLIEAIACGVPVLAGKSSGGVAWTLGDGRYGTLCDVTDPVMIAQSALAIIKAGTCHRPTPDEAWKAIRDQAGIDHVAQQYLDFFVGMIKKPHDKIMK